MTAHLMIFSTPELADALEAYHRPEGSDSDICTTVTNMVLRYAECCRRSLPALTRQEWLLICDALNGTWLAESSGGYSAAAVLEIEIADAIAINALDAKWGILGTDLPTRLHALDYAARLAVIDVVERFWAGGDERVIDVAVTRGQRGA